MELNKRVIQEIEKASQVGAFLWQREWAERNGGNISLNLTDIFGEKPKNLEDFTFVSTEGYPKEAGGDIYFVTGTQMRLRELNHPENAACIVLFNIDATGFYIIWGGAKDVSFRPTSEFISHVKIHVDNKIHNPQHRAVVHTHALELICISHHPELSQDEKRLNHILWGMLPEVRAFVPKGVGVTPYTLPGSEALANLTVEGLRSRDVVLWNKHGAIACGEDALVAFDYIDVANKGAKLYLKCLASGYEPLGLTHNEMSELEEVFNL